MNSKRIFFIIMLLAFGFTVAAQNSTNKYLIKSAIITFKNNGAFLGNTGGTSQDETLWFDDYGKKETRLRIEDSEVKLLGMKKTEHLETLEIRNGDHYWHIDLVAKTGTHSSMADMDKNMQGFAKSTGLEGNFEKYKGKSEEEAMKMFIKDNGGTYHGKVNFLGKECMDYTILGTRQYMYKRIVLKAFLTDGRVTIEATSFKENVTIPADKFKVPAGITIEEQPNGLDMGALMQGMGEEGGEASSGEDGETFPSGISLTEFKAIIKNVKPIGYKFMGTMEEGGEQNATWMKSDNSDAFAIVAQGAKVYDKCKNGEWEMEPGVNVEKIDEVMVNGKKALVFRVIHDDEGVPSLGIILQKKSSDLSIFIAGSPNSTKEFLISVAKSLVL